MESKKKSNASEKYWEGLSTPEEESWLENNISPLDDDASYFDLLNQFRSLNLSDDVEANIIKSLPIERKMGRTWWKVAAAIAVVVGVGLTVMKQNYPVTTNGLTSQELRELEMTREALFLMSSKLNEGLSFTYSLGEFDEAINTISE